MFIFKYSMSTVCLPVDLSRAAGVSEPKASVAKRGSPVFVLSTA